ncbi:AbrB/MazE/SpoVT family DNA-binding domain-containing protein [Desulfoscipio gibsoniae]|uniref:Uncharacterized protein n=1 Tax=Desulfoscipio gibsoniae DSM 7213 TaxID=767817 RepID=R4KTG1_9FIRM|nr:AbrB/MazE/SpoVT family DNA-binding domain-containing protein [Desulfoscipio gibsoniae]AGL02901.1 hypothetical protein Desgi_3578 [Desulfoscipio gibsoniae DSM 7213]
MKLFKMVTSVDKHGRITLQTGALDAAGLKPGDEVNVTLAVDADENTCPQIVLTPIASEADEPLCDCEEDGVEISLSLPDLLLEAAEISEASALKIVCAPGAIVILEADILDNLPDELHELFAALGINPDTVREVMRKEGYFV